MMMVILCGMVEQQKAFSLISSRDHCQRSSPLRISDMPQAGFEPAQSLTSSLVACWTPIKIKINMICVSKDYEINTKMEQEQWLQLKMLFLLEYKLRKVLFSWGGHWL